MIYEKQGNVRHLIINGYSISQSEESVIACDSGSSIEFNKISIENRGRLSIQACSSMLSRTIFTDTVEGDAQSELIMGNTHRLFVAYKGEASYDLPLSIRVLQGGLLQVPNALSIKPFIKLYMRGRLVGAKSLTCQPQSELTVEFPGFSSYVDLSFSRFSFQKLLIESRASVKTKSNNKVKFDIANYELQYNGVISSYIPLVATNKVIQTLGPALGRTSCPHGHEIVNIASAVIYDPCGTGKLVTAPRNVSYLANITVHRNTSRLEIVNRTMVIDGKNVTVNETATRYSMQPVQVEVTKWKIVYNISCDYDDFKLLVGQKCTLKTGLYKYSSLMIYQQASMEFESNGVESINLEVGTLIVSTDGKITVKQHSLPNGRYPKSSIGGSHWWSWRESENWLRGGKECIWKYHDADWGWRKWWWRLEWSDW